MSVFIKYLNVEKATIDALRDCRDQIWKLENDPKRIRGLESDMTSLRGISYSAPVHGGGNRQEERLCGAIDEKMALEHGYKQAVEYKTKFMPCWERLTEEERDMLRLRFVDHLEGGGIGQIMQKYNIGKTEAYERSNKALRRLTKLLFW